MNSIAGALLSPVLALIVIVLVFNLSQRRQLEHGERKRFASLGIAGLLLLLYAGAWSISRLDLSDALLIPLAALVGLIGFGLRDKLFRFRLHCVACGKTLRVSSILYHDDSLCDGCRTPKDASIPAPRRPWPGGVVPEQVSDIDWENWEPDEYAVLCFVRDENRLLLIHKKTGLGAGKINAPGGRIEPGETAERAAVRETEEETGITPIAVSKRVDLSFVFTNGYSLHGSVFLAESYSGKPAATEEADPFWCDVTALPFDRMWEDDAVWIPLMLEGKSLRARFVFDGDRMKSSVVEELG